MVHIYDTFTPVREPITDEEELLKDYPTSVGTITTSAKNYERYRKLALPVISALYKKKQTPFVS